MHPIMLLLCGVLASPSGWAWNPYDTDSSWSGAKSDRRFVLPEAERPGSWDSRSQWYLPEDQPRNQWSPEPGRASDYGWDSAPEPTDWAAPDRWRDGAEIVDDRWRQPKRGRARSAGSEPLETNGYQFRHDPKLDARQADQRNGWQFRPRSEREQARSVAENRRYPPIDEREYYPRGPWRSYQDEGAAFGYHADDLRSNGSPRQWPR
ncbi:hypothetical protein CCR82_17030 [Halochromatium salexigens]|uniref:Uncharacterized protein n=1 Tax=Halochromatium salexigens TaxID=49447 RepID=A0AAJ0XGJ9_HALSE|nr:hypothetical protein [Halochromatium salexigens]